MRPEYVLLILLVLLPMTHPHRSRQDENEVQQEHHHHHHQQQQQQSGGFRRQRTRNHHSATSGARSMTKDMLNSMLGGDAELDAHNAYLEDHHTKFIRSDRIGRLKALWENPIGFPDEHPREDDPVQSQEVLKDTAVLSKHSTLADKINSTFIYFLYLYISFIFHLVFFYFQLLVLTSSHRNQNIQKKI